MAVYQNCPECGQRDGMIEMPFNVQGFCDDHRLIWELRRKDDGKPVPAGQKQDEWKVLGTRRYHRVGPHAPAVVEQERQGPYVVVGRERQADGKILTHLVRVSDGPGVATGPRGQPFVFKHGLGDAITFAHSIPLYIRRGYSVSLACTPDKEIIFRASGATVVPEANVTLAHDYPYPDGIPAKMPADWLPFNKLWHSISHPPMPDIGQATTIGVLGASRVSLATSGACPRRAMIDRLIESHAPTERPDWARPSRAHDSPAHSASVSCPDGREARRGQRAARAAVLASQSPYHWHKASGGKRTPDRDTAPAVQAACGPISRRRRQRGADVVAYENCPECGTRDGVIEKKTGP